MDLHLLTCPNCGESKLKEENGLFSCRVCGTTLDQNKAEDFANRLEAMMNSKGEADIGRLRYLLNQEINKPLWHKSLIESYCRDILTLIPDDFKAGFCLAFIHAKKFPREYESFLSSHESIQLSGYDKRFIYPLLIDQCSYEALASTKDFLLAQGDLDLCASRLEDAMRAREEENDRFANIERDVFVCHASSELDKIMPIIEKLEGDGYTCWYSERNLPKDIENYKVGIENAIRSCRIFLAFMSTASIMSKDCQWEMDIAEAQGKSLRAEYRLEERKNNPKFKRFFDGIQWIDGALEDASDELTERIDSLLSSAPKQEAPIEVPPAPKEEPKEKHPLPKASEEEGLEIEKEPKPTIETEPKEEDPSIEEAKRKAAEEEAEKLRQGIYFEVNGEERSYPARKNPEGNKAIYDVELSASDQVVIKEGGKTLAFGADGAAAYACQSSGPHVFYVNRENKVYVVDPTQKRTEEKPETPSEGFKASSGDTAATRKITDYQGKSIDVVVPSEWDGCPVVSIGDGTFSGRTDIRSISIPSSVTYIGNEAFKGCENLLSVKLRDGLEYIGASAFFGCRHLRDIEIPKSVETIEGNAFDGCSSIERIALPSKMTKVAEGAFARCASLKDAALGKNIIDIEAKAFMQCVSLEAIDFPDGLATIGRDAFCGCASLEKIHIPAKVIKIDQPFANTPSLEKITVSKDNVVFIDGGANAIIKDGTIISGCLATVIPKGIKAIGSYAFFCCSALKEIAIPSSVTSIGEWAFQGCKSLESIKIPSSVSSIEKGTFRYCSALKEIAIPSSVKSIAHHAFESCCSLESIEIPSSVAYIGDKAFFECASLASISIPSSTTSIGEWAFHGCKSLESIWIPSSVTSIGKYAFNCCPNLTINFERTKFQRLRIWLERDWNPDHRPVKWGVKKPE